MRTTPLIAAPAALWAFAAPAQTPEQTEQEDAYFAERIRWSEQFISILDDAKRNGLEGYPEVVAWMVPSLDWNWTIVTVETVRGQQIWRRTRHAGDEGVRTDWAMRGRCASLEPMLEAMEEIPTPAIDLYSVGAPPEDVIFTADGAGFGLNVRLFASGEPDHSYGGLEITSNYGSPLAGWFLEMQDVTEHCWTDEPPGALLP